MDFYTRKTKIGQSMMNFLKARSTGSKKTWAEFCREMFLEYGVGEEYLKGILKLIEDKLTVKDGELAKKNGR